jgi:CRISPR-associated protein Cmr6
MRTVIRYAKDSHGRDVLLPAGGYRPDGGMFGAGSNALVMLSRIAVFETGRPGEPGADQVKLADAGKRALTRWAVDRKLGQDAGLVAAVAGRRELALRSLSGHRTSRYKRLLATPEWRLAVGHGNKANAHEIGLALHGTYGWPVIPGSSLKGLALAWARSCPEADEDAVRRVFGTTSRMGSVRFLDAIPAGKPVTVEADVLTPHVKPYYDAVASGSGSVVPPAEYHNPVPVMFLTVTGTYAVDLYGPDQKDIDLAARWLREAGDELGAGAKTAAGYGYLSVGPADGSEPA